MRLVELPFLILYCHLLLRSVLGITASNRNLIDSLPGLPTKLGFKQYSGYLAPTKTIRLHYWFVESEKNPSSDPLVLWLNGGPGCSSLDGFLTENGPFRVNNDTKTLSFNQYSWNKIANVLYLESPAGVGFSYDTNENYTTDDDKVADANLAALKDFMSKYPEFKGRDFYITGESYAGIYIPTLMKAIDEDSSFNLKGALIGNGYFVPTKLTSSKIHYWYYHGMIGSGLWNQMLTECCEDQVSDECEFLPFKTSACRDVLTEAMTKVNDLPLNPYNIYNECRGAKVSKHQRKLSKISSLLRQLSTDLDTNNKEFTDTFVQQSKKDDHAAPCMDDTPTAGYLNREIVKRALHIEETTGLPPWSTCSPLIDDEPPINSYKRVYDDMRPTLASLVPKYRLWVFNGDLDTVCDFLGDEEIIDSLGYKEVKKYQPWYFQDELEQKQIGGFCREFENELTFLTVKGAGHMVPTDQPLVALEMLRRFLNGERI